MVVFIAQEGSLREGGHCGDQDVDGRIILRWIFRKLEGVMGTGWSWLRIGTGGRTPAEIVSSNPTGGMDICLL